MTNPVQFLETEAALKALTDELTAIKAASESLEEAKVSVQNLTQMSEKVIFHASVVSKNSDQLLANFGATQEQISIQSSAVRQSLLENQGKTEEVLQKAGELNLKIETMQKRIDEIAEETQKRDADMSNAASRLADHGQTTQILVICCLSLSFFTLIVVLIPYIQKLLLR